MYQFCPHGVEYWSLEDCCQILDNKRKPITKALREAGEYPYYGANGIQDYVSEYIFDGVFVLVGEDGSVITPSGSPVVTWAEGKIWVNNHAHVVKEKDGVLLRYLYHYLQTVDVSTLIHGNIPKLTGGDFRAIKIPVPPMEVQREIVQILDNFTELSAELSARKKQYEYYRRSLLNSKNNTPMIPLKDIIKKSCSGATPAKGNPEYHECGTIPWLRTQDVRFNEIFQIDNFITEKAVRETAAKWIPPNCVIVAISGATAGRCAINKIATTTNQHCLNLEIDSEKALYKYVFYCVCDKYEELLSKKQGARGDLNSSIILSLAIPLPLLDEQQRIVSLLDRFDALCNDISTGLPAEIEARQKQYEYYRDKLLTFKELV